jgi:tRNA threonylcarbamoyladenosine biosynthesis protein TsaB
MIILAIDSALDACQAAIARDNEILAALSEPMSRGQAERLAPMVKETAEAAAIAFADLDRIVVTTGPGSFTGVRVGLSFARALALALARPCIGISTLEGLAFETGQGGLRAALVETPGAAYAALYEEGAPLLAPRAVEKGQAHQIVRDAAGGREFQLRQSSSPIDLAALARRAAHLSPDAYPPDPLYLRAPLKQMSET